MNALKYTAIFKKFRKTAAISMVQCHPGCSSVWPLMPLFGGVNVTFLAVTRKRSVFSRSNLRKSPTECRRSLKVPFTHSRKMIIITSDVSVAQHYLVTLGARWTLFKPAAYVFSKAVRLVWIIPHFVSYVFCREGNLIKTDKSLYSNLELQHEGEL
jgi:hypothetical protein